MAKITVASQVATIISTLEAKPSITNAELAAKGYLPTAIKLARVKVPYAKPTFTTEGERHALMGTYGPQAQAEAVAARNAPKAKPEPVALPVGAKPAATATKPAKGTKSAAETKPAKEAKVKGPSELYLQIVKFMKKGKPYTTRDIVVGLGRTPGNAGGGPVVRELKKLEAEKKVTYASGEAVEGFKTGYVWTLAK